MASLLAPALGSTVLGTETVGAERREALPWPLFLGDPGNKLRSLHYKVRLSALRLPSKGEKKTKAKLARWRENEAAWLFEI
jgi:hypothetical protein